MRKDKYLLLILSLACSLRLLLALYAGLFIVLSLTKLGEDSRTSTLTLKTTECAVKRLAVFYLYFCHFFFPPLALQSYVGFPKSYSNIIHY